jgi:cytoskeletal protein CcmA (bactofilin family)
MFSGDKPSGGKGESRELNTFIGSDSVLHGKLSIENSIRIDGRIEGEVSSTGVLTVGPNGEVEGDIFAVSSIIGGKVRGSISSTKSIVLEAQSVFIGNLTTAKLTIAEGAMFEGKCTMLEEDGVKNNGKQQPAQQHKQQTPASK